MRKPLLLAAAVAMVLSGGLCSQAMAGPYPTDKDITVIIPKNQVAALIPLLVALLI